MEVYLPENPLRWAYETNTLTLQDANARGTLHDNSVTAKPAAAPRSVVDRSAYEPKA